MGPIGVKVVSHCLFRHNCDPLALMKFSCVCPNVLLPSNKAGLCYLKIFTVNDPV